MRVIKRLIAWSLLSLAIQFCVLFYIDRECFKHSSNFKIVQVDKTVEQKKQDLFIPSNATNVDCSYDGKYISYFVDNKFYVVNVSTLQSNEVITGDKARSILYCEWLYNRDRIIVAEKKDSSNGKVVNILNYDPQNNDEELLKELCDYSDGIKVDDIAVSTANGVTYVEVSDKGVDGSIYRIDINESIDEVTKWVGTLASLEVFQYNDKMVYIDSNNGNLIYVYSGGKTQKIPVDFPNKLKIIGLIGTQTIYLGEQVDGKITAIIYGDLNQNSSTWKKQSLLQPKDINDVFVNEKGQILIDNNNGSIQNLSTGVKTNYEGVLVKMTNEIIFSLNNGKVCIKECT